MKGDQFVDEPRQFAKCLLTYNSDKTTIYWQFERESEKNPFAATNRIDLRTIVFGTEPLVFVAWSNVWTKQSDPKTPWKESYRITLSNQEASHSITNRFLPKEKIIELILETKQPQFRTELDSLRHDLANANTEFKNVDKKLKDFKEQETKLETIDKEIKDLDEQISDAKDDQTKRNLQTQINAKRGEREQMPLFKERIAFINCRKRFPSLNVDGKDGKRTKKPKTR